MVCLKVRSIPKAVATYVVEPLLKVFVNFYCVGCGKAHNTKHSAYPPNPVPNSMNSYSCSIIIDTVFSGRFTEPKTKQKCKRF